MNELVCLDLDGGPSFVDRLCRAWDDGDAIFPLDRRLPEPAKRAVLAEIRPTIIADESGDTRVRGRPVDSGDAVVVATSGTTGLPKAAVLTHDAVLSSARAVSRRLDIGPDDRWFACLPPAHVGGLSVILRSIVTGTPCIVSSRFSAEAYVDAARNGATLVSLVATALARVDPSLYRVIVLGGSRAPANRPANSVSTYGMTETGSGVVYDGEALDGVEVQVREGIIHLRAPMLMRAYRDGTVPFDSDGWFRTGDIGHVDHAGRLVVEGREGDLIVTGGENVWPDVVESRLIHHPAIAECCIAGVPDPEWGHAVHAWIVVVPGRSVTLEDLRAFVKDELPAWCAPRAIHLVGEIPRTALGKPQRSRLVATSRSDG